MAQFPVSVVQVVDLVSCLQVYQVGKGDDLRLYLGSNVIDEVLVNETAALGVSLKVDGMRPLG